MRTKILFILIAFAMTLAGCHQHKEHEHDSDDHTNHDHSEDFIYFTQDQA